MNSYYRFMETSLDTLKNSTISEEDSRLVDSILNELNSNDKGPQHLTQPPQRPTQQPQQMVQQPQQMAQQPQQMIQQQPQQMAQQPQQMIQQQPQQMAQQPPQQMAGDISILDDLKNKSTLLLLVFVLLIMIQSYPMNYILSISPETFFSEAGECNLSGVIIKSFIVCIIYYVATKYLF
jgi:flagellar biosynthesis GTPase FlhF